MVKGEDFKAQIDNYDAEEPNQIEHVMNEQDVIALVHIQCILAVQYIAKPCNENQLYLYFYTNYLLNEGFYGPKLNKIRSEGTRRSLDPKTGKNILLGLP